MAVGVILIDLSPGQNSDFLMAYLFGSCRPFQQIIYGLWLLSMVLLYLLYFYFIDNLMPFFDKFAKVKGIHTSFFSLFFNRNASFFVVVISIRLVDYFSYGCAKYP